MAESLTATLLLQIFAECTGKIILKIRQYFTK